MVRCIEAELPFLIDQVITSLLVGPSSWIPANVFSGSWGPRHCDNEDHKKAHFICLQ